MGCNSSKSAVKVSEQAKKDKKAKSCKQMDDEESASEEEEEEEFEYTDYQKESLEAHNEYRAKHGARPMKLSKALCEYSQEWADHLVEMGSMSHRSGPQVNGKSVGENLAFKYDSSVDSFPGGDAVKMWYDEIKDYDFSNQGFNQNTGHFTQVVWKKSVRLGVGVARDAQGQQFSVCNYAPAGNMMGDFEDNVQPPNENEE